MIKEYDHLFKLVIIGNSGVGKSSLLLRFSDDAFSETYLTTLGVDFKFKSMDLDGKSVKIQIWDTAGQERFRTITNAYYKGANAIIVVYDVTNENSFNDIEKFWIQEITQNAEPDVKLMMIGNKCDQQKTVSSESAKQYAQKNDMFYFETSAKSGECVKEAFQTLTKQLIKDESSKGINGISQFQTRLQNQNDNYNSNKKQNKKCC